MQLFGCCVPDWVAYVMSHLHAMLPLVQLIYPAYHYSYRIASPCCAFFFLSPSGYLLSPIVLQSPSRRIVKVFGSERDTTAYSLLYVIFRNVEGYAHAPLRVQKGCSNTSRFTYCVIFLETYSSCCGFPVCSMFIQKRRLEGAILN